MKIEITDLLGRPYERGARGPAAYDCWGVIVVVGRRLGIPFPDWNDIDWSSSTGHMQLIAKASRETPWNNIPIDQLQVGDVALSRQPDSSVHAGIYMGSGLVLHADSQAGVIVLTLESWLSSYVRTKWARLQ